jgi:hypothetical protein
MKTAMQELIEILKKSKKLLEDSIQENGGLDNQKNKNSHYYSLGIGECIIEANQLLEKEKEQIIDAHFNGMDKLATSLSEFLPIKHTMSVIQEIKNGGDIHEDGEQYYNQTYKEDKITINQTKRSIEGIGLYNQNK